MRKRYEAVVNINRIDSGARLRELRKNRAEKVKHEFTLAGVNDKDELKRLCKEKELSDFREIGFQNRKHIKEMMNGSREITEEVLEFYSEKCNVPKAWILYGTFLDYVKLVLNPVPCTVSEEDCIKVEVEAQIQRITYGQSEEIMQIAQNLKVLPRISPFSNLVDIYDNVETGKGQILILFINLSKGEYMKTFPPVLTAMLAAMNSKLAMTMTFKGLFVHFVDKFLRDYSWELQNLVGMLGISQKILLDEDYEKILEEELSDAERRKILPKYSQLREKARKQQEEMLNSLNIVLGREIDEERDFPIVHKYYKIMALLDKISQRPEWDSKIKQEIPQKVVKDELNQGVSFQDIFNNQEIREKAEKVLDELIEIFEKAS